MTTSEDTETLSLPSLAIVTILGYLLYRYFFSPSSTTNNPSNTSSTSRTSFVTGPNGTRYRFTPSQLDTVSSMFPQLSRRDIMWDLQRNGGSVQATTERILGGRGLDAAPPSFQPVLPAPTDPATNPSRTSVASLLRGAQKKEEVDLITRYNLQARVKSSDKGKAKESDGSASVGGDEGKSASGSGSATGTGTGTGTGWATTKDARQSILQRRRDEMILEARRKMMERDAARGAGSAGGDGSGEVSASGS